VNYAIPIIAALLVILGATVWLGGKGAVGIDGPHGWRGWLKVAGRRRGLPEARVVDAKAAKDITAASTGDAHIEHVESTMGGIRAEAGLANLPVPADPNDPK
jgi:hypothetical protein